MPAAAAAERPLPLYLVSRPKAARDFGGRDQKRRNAPFARLCPDGASGGNRKRRTFLLAALVKLSIVLVVLFRKHELQLAAWVASPPPSYCAALAASTPTTPSPLVCAHAGTGDPSPDSPDALRQALAAGTGCVLLHVSSTADGELAVIRNTPQALGLLTRPRAGSPLALRAASLPGVGGARGWWRRATVGDLKLAELRTLRWRRPTRRRAGWGGDGEGEGGAAAAVLTLQEALRLLVPPDARAAKQPPLLLIVDVERPTGAALSSVPLGDFVKRAVAAAKEGGCGGGGGGGGGERSSGVRCLFWAMRDDVVAEAGVALGRLRATKKTAAERRGGQAESAAAPAYEPTPAAASSGGGGGGGGGGDLPGLGYFVAERRDPRHPRFEGGAASAAAVHASMLLQQVGGGSGTGVGGGGGGGGGGGAAVTRSLHAAGQRLFAYVINRAGPLRAAVVAGADAVVTDRPTDVARVLAAWRRQCEAAATGRRG
jgi:glycerophosphoryl diester phosphodiesterase